MEESDDSYDPNENSRVVKSTPRIKKKSALEKDCKLTENLLSNSKSKTPTNKKTGELD